MKKFLFFFGCILLLISCSTYGQCLIPSDDGDTLMPVVNRLTGTSTVHRGTINTTTVVGNTLYLGGGFQYIGPNTGTGVVSNEGGSQVLSYKKWRINGPVYVSVSDGAGGFFIGGLFTKVGDSTRINLAHIDQDGIPTNWKPVTNDVVRALAIVNDTLYVGGAFTMVNNNSRKCLALINTNIDTLYPLIIANNGQVQPNSCINTFKRSGNILYVGGKFNPYNLMLSAWKIFLNDGSASNLPNIFQMEEVFVMEVSDNGGRVYVGGHAGGGPAISNGMCMNTYTGALLYRMDVGNTSYQPEEGIYQIRAMGRTVFAGGYFDHGNINGNSFSQKGIIAFDTTSGQLRPYLTNCNGSVEAIQSIGDKVYIGGQFTSIAGQTLHNFAIFDTTTLTVNTSTFTISDQPRTFSFSGTRMFIGGFFHSIGCVARNGFADINLATGQVGSWQPDVYPSGLHEMKSVGDTIFMAGSFFRISPPGNYLGSLMACSASSGDIYNTPVLSGLGFSLLIDGDSLYVGGATGSYGNNNMVKIFIPNLSEVGTWKPNPGYDVKGIYKRNGKLYALGDNYRINITKGFLSEINATTGQRLRTIDLSPTPGFSWFTSSVLSGSKLFFNGLFSKITNIPRGSFAVFDVDRWALDSIRLSIFDFNTFSKIVSYNGNLYFGGSYIMVNGRPRLFFSVIDTTVGAVFPDRVHLNNDDPYGYPLDDLEGYERLNSFEIVNGRLILAGNFRNINQKMFPTLVSLRLVPGNGPPSTPQGINGSSSLTCPSQNNLYTILNPDPNSRYAWFYTGNDVLIRNNGTDSVYLDAGPLATPGQLKVIALNDCGHSDTAFLSLSINTLEPTVNASNLILVRRTDTSATVRFTPGNGARRLVVIRALNPITNTPADGSEYAADSVFNHGADLGNNSYVVYKGAGDSANIRGLSPETLYYVTVFEFNGIYNNTNYLITGNPTLNFRTFATRPTAQGAFAVTNITTTSMTINATPGNGTGRILVMRAYGTAPQAVMPADGIAYTPSVIFGSGSDLGNGNFVVSVGTYPVTITNLLPNTQYGITLFEYSGTGDATSYLIANYPNTVLFTAATEPTVQTSNILVSNITNNSCQINCTPGNGNFRLLVMRESLPVIFAPQDMTYYPGGSSTITFGAGANLGNNTYVLNYSTPVNVNGLTPNTVYHIAAFEFNVFVNNWNYLSANPATAFFNTSPSRPTAQAGSLSISAITNTTASSNCSSGNGTNRLFVIRAGSPITDNPVDGMDYNASTVFGAGSNIGNNTYVLSKQQPVNITGLTPGITYYIKVFEFNGVGQSTQYLLTGAPAISFSTFAPEPTVPASNIVASNISDNSVTINCTSGNGGNRLVVIRASTTISAQPQDGIAYAASTIFGSGADLGNQTYVVSNTNVPVTITGLSPNSDYTVSVFEFNGSGSASNYLLTNNPLLTFHTLYARPTVPSGNLTINNIGTNGASINGNAGNGTGRLVVITAGASLTAAPANGVSYIVNPAFGLGASIGNQTYALATGLPVSVTNLSPNSEYTVSSFEYNGTGSLTNYLTSGNPLKTFRTLEVEPTTQSTNIIFSNITDNSVVVNCIIGNGSNRLVVIRSSTSISVVPQDGVVYTASPVFGSGADLGAQTYVVSNTGVPVTITGLTPNADYTVTVFEFNGSGAACNYLVNNNSVATFHTLYARPTIATTSLTINNITANAATINGIAGDGSGRLVVITAGSTITSLPTNGSSYSVNPSFGAGAPIGNQVYSVSSNLPVIVTDLTPNTEYAVSVFEYNGSGSLTNYLATNNPITTFRTTFVTGIVDLGIQGTIIKVYPNPVSNNKLYISVQSNKRGKFSTEIFSNSGATLFKKDFFVGSGTANFTIDFPFSSPSSLLYFRCYFQGRTGICKILKF